MLTLNQNQKEEIILACEKAYPSEGCGLIFGKVDESSNQRIAHLIVVCENEQDKFHQKDPKRYPRDSKTAYTIDAKKMEEHIQSAKKQGFELICIFHSHPDHGVYFSVEDKEMAAPWGEPLFPAVSYLVVAVDKQKATGASDFYWDKEKKDFIANPLF